MFEAIRASAYIVYSVVYYCFHFSYKIGQFLVTCSWLLVQNLLTLFSNFFELVHVILESFAIFSQDVVQGVQQIIRLVSNAVDLIASSISTTLSDIVNAIETVLLFLIAVYDFIVNSVLSVVTGIGQIFVFLKRLIVLFGSGVWFSLTFIPLIFVYIGTLCVYYMRKLFDDTVDFTATCLISSKVALKNLYEFLTDVPVESAAGLMVAFCLAYIFMQFYVTIYLYLYEQLQNIFSVIYRRCNGSRRRRINSNATARTISPYVRIPSRSTPQIRSELVSSKSTKDQSFIDERYCVICQERIKCILVLPCRHVCMCSECNFRLQLYNNTCPICRNDIDSTMKIFV